MKPELSMKGYQFTTPLSRPVERLGRSEFQDIAYNDGLDVGAAHAFAHALKLLMTTSPDVAVIEINKLIEPKGTLQ